MFPEGQLHWIFFPQGKEGIYLFGKQLQIARFTTKLRGLPGALALGVSTSG
jgi:hypothetical protein